MPLHATYIKEQDRLDLSFSGNLDVSLTLDICNICRNSPSNMAICIVDLSDVERLFDSGVALLQMLYWRMKEFGTMVEFVSGCPEVHERIPDITRRRSNSRHELFPSALYPGPKARSETATAVPLSPEMALGADARMDRY